MRLGRRLSPLAHALVLLVALVLLPAARASFGWPYLSKGGDSVCPMTNPSWKLSGVYGGIVDSQTRRGALGSANLLYQYYPQAGKGCKSAASCKALCDAWPYFNGKRMTSFNGDNGLCAYWSWNGNSDCYLYGCAVCKSVKSFYSRATSNGKRYRSGAGSRVGRCWGPGVKGDPHFTGGDLSHFDFTGDPGNFYCIVSDSHLHINAFYGGRYDGHGKPLTWIRQLGLLWGHHTVKLFARAGPEWAYNQGYMERMEVDGQEVRLSQPGDVLFFADGKIQLAWLAAREPSGDDEVDVYQVAIQGTLVLRLTLRPEIADLRTPDDGVVHFNLQFEAIDLSNNAHGVLGQTYRPDHKFRLLGQVLEFNKVLQVNMVKGLNADGFLDGSVGDYRSNHLEASDCRMSRFARLEFLDAETSHAMEFNLGTIESDANGPPRRSLLAGTNV